METMSYLRERTATLISEIKFGFNVSLNIPISHCMAEYVDQGFDETNGFEQKTHFNQLLVDLLSGFSILYGFFNALAIR